MDELNFTNLNKGYVFTHSEILETILKTFIGDTFNPDAANETAFTDVAIDDFNSESSEALNLIGVASWFCYRYILSQSHGYGRDF